MTPHARPARLMLALALSALLAAGCARDGGQAVGGQPEGGEPDGIQPANSEVTAPAVASRESGTDGSEGTTGVGSVSDTEGAVGAGGAAGSLGQVAPPGAELEPEEIYSRISLSVAYVETPLATGSAVMVRPGIALTNAHVVWPFDTVRVVFPDGTELTNARVIGRDEMADLALLDVVSAAASLPEPVSVGDGTALPIGSAVYLVGYPGESEEYPQPAISRGLLSRLRKWDAIDMPYLQSDADIAGGQSGGVLVADDGRVIGFSSMIFGESAFGLSASAPDVLARADRMLAGEDVDGVDSRPMPTGEGKTEMTATLDGYWDEAVFVLEAPYGVQSDVSAVGVSAATLAALDPYGELLFEDDSGRDGTARGAVVTRYDGPHFVVVNMDEPGSAAIRSSTPLLRLIDPDDGDELSVGSRHLAVMDYPGDFDHYTVRLEPGRRVTVTVDTANFSPELIIEGPDSAATPAGSEVWIGGPLGLTASTTFTPDRPGEYTIVVDDVEGIGTGGYFLTIE